ncbi:MAG: GDSL-type esterase/lipase family protein [Fibrobacteria bacterium]
MKTTVILVAGILAGAATAFAPAAASVRLFIIGDSTVSNYKASEAPMTGWGQLIGSFFADGSVTVNNRAIGGRSTRSFIEDGHWTSVKAELGQGDYLLIQFGHNDRGTVAERHADTAQYRRYLTQYVDEARAKGAIPILVSPMNMNAWNGATLRRVFTEGVNDYRAAMLRVAQVSKVPFVDLEKKSADLFQSLGQDYITRFLFMTLLSGEYPNYASGKSDGTHFQDMGALEMARLVAEGIKELSADTSVQGLASNLAPLIPLTVVSDKTSAGMVTRSGNYPPKAPITLKAIPKSGETFLGWSEANVKPASTAARESIVMPEAPAAWRASFKGGVTAVAPVSRAAVSRKGKASLRDAAGRAGPRPGPKFNGMTPREGKPR